jgi:hypothetical protein
MTNRDSSHYCFHRNVHFYIRHLHQSKSTRKYSATSFTKNFISKRKRINNVQNVPFCDIVYPQTDVNITEYVSKLVV